MNFRAEVINPFIQAACEVVAAETNMRVDRGTPRYLAAPSTTQDMIVLVGVTGEHLSGMVLVGMRTRTALALVGRIMGQTFNELDALAQSGIAELANVIVGRAATLLAATGFECTITPPMVIVGSGAQVSSLAVQRLIVPLHLGLGTIEMQIALRANAQNTAP